MRRKILSLLLCISVSVTALVGCGSNSEEISETDKDIIIAEDASTKNNKQSSFKNWKKYCLTDEFLNEEFEYDEWLEDFEDESEEDDFNIDEWKEYNIVDVNDDGIPEILERDNVISFYNFSSKWVDVKEPEIVSITYNASSVFFLEDSNTIILPMSDISLDSPCAFIVMNWMCDDSSSMKIDFETALTNGAYNRTGYFIIDYNDCDNKDLEGVSAQEAINLANEFAGVDVTSLHPADYPYTLGELVEALRNY